MKHAALLSLALLVVAGCAKKEAPAPDVAVPAAPAKVSEATGFLTPESVLWDAEQQVWFVSNINGSPLAKDGNGFISRLTADGVVDSLNFVLGGRGGVTLHAPKGMALVGDTLWVTDIDAIRGFNRRTGALVAAVELGSQAKFLNDAVTGPDGTVYITDTGMGMDEKGNFLHPGPDRIFALKGRAATVAAEGDWLERPNGIAWDGANNRYLVVPFGGNALLGWVPGAATGDSLAAGPGMQDGVEILNGQTLVTSWTDSTVFVMDAAGAKKLITGVNSPADIGVDQVRGLVAIPLFLENRVEFWKVGS
ncbi:MAG: SMP-30/gluconolactonase/LRE family protein [Gemmatimonadetes bacterium]|nr:SMP-30/gluconolactonase/LRE family protein [Gemmatimonadota bacterium]